MWKLINRANGERVNLGDKTNIRDDVYIVTSFTPPHKTSAVGKVGVRRLFDKFSIELYVSVFNYEWKKEI